jgi:hypothetical protein
MHIADLQQKVVASRRLLVSCRKDKKGRTEVRPFVIHELA